MSRVNPMLIAGGVWFLFVLVLILTYENGYRAGFRAQTPVALCWNVDSIRIHDTHWDQSKRDTATRTIPAPPCPHPLPPRQP